MSISKDTAESQAETAHNAAETAANTNFISDLDTQIAEGIAQGKFHITGQTIDVNVNAKTVAQHYLDLGYKVLVLSAWPSEQPAILFGEQWIDYWEGNFFPTHPKLPFRMRLSWEA